MCDIDIDVGSLCTSGPRKLRTDFCYSRFSLTSLIAQVGWVGIYLLWALMCSTCKRLSMYFHGKSGMLIVNVERLKSTFKPIYTPISFNTRSVASRMAMDPLPPAKVSFNLKFPHAQHPRRQPSHYIILICLAKNSFSLSQSLPYSPSFVFCLSSSSPQRPPPSLSRFTLYCCPKDMKLQITRIQNQFEN